MISRIKKEQNKGFTLPELLTGLVIFSLIIGTASEVFLSAIRAQRKSLAYQEMLDQTSYFEEYISRAIRMAKKDIDGTCTGEVNLNYKKNDLRTLDGSNYSGPGIVFLNYQDECQEFFLDISDSRLKESKNKASPVSLTSSSLTVSSFRIAPENEEGWSQNDDLQPRVTLFLEITGGGEKPEQKVEIKIQTTISQRNIDIKI